MISWLQDVYGSTSKVNDELGLSEITQKLTNVRIPPESISTSPAQDETKVETKDATKCETKGEAKCGTEDETKCAIKGEAKCAIKGEAKCAIKSESKCAIKGEIKCATECETKGATECETKGATECETKGATECETKGATECETKGEAKCGTEGETWHTIVPAIELKKLEKDNKSLQVLKKHLEEITIKQEEKILDLLREIVQTKQDNAKDDILRDQLQSKIAECELLQEQQFDNQMNDQLDRKGAARQEESPPKKVGHRIK